MQAPSEIVASPWDEGLRLAWADRIAQDHPERAAYVRVALEIRGLRRRSVGVPRTLMGQESRLLEAHYVEWSAHVAPLARFCSLAAGCVEEACFTAAQWLEGGQQFRAIEPLLDVSILGVSGHLDRVLGSPGLEGLRSLRLDGGLGDAAVAKIARCGQLADLCVLNLAGNDVGEAGLEAIAEHLPRLQFLDFRGNRVRFRPTVAEEGELVHGVWATPVAKRLEARFGPRQWLSRYDLPYVEGMRPR